MSSIGGQTAGPIETQIGTNSLWDNEQKLWGRRSRVLERGNELEAREYMDGKGRNIRREREVRVWGARSAHGARSAKLNKILRNLRQTHMLERVIRRRRIFDQLD
jgi:hypothetical protein